MVDTADLKSADGNIMRVRVSPRAQELNFYFIVSTHSTISESEAPALKR